MLPVIGVPLGIGVGAVNAMSGMVVGGWLSAFMAVL